MFSSIWICVAIPDVFNWFQNTFESLIHFVCSSGTFGSLLLLIVQFPENLIWNFWKRYFNNNFILYILFDCSTIFLVGNQTITKFNSRPSLSFYHLSLFHHTIGHDYCLCLATAVPVSGYADKISLLPSRKRTLLCWNVSNVSFTLSVCNYFWENYGTVILYRSDKW